MSSLMFGCNSGVPENGDTCSLGTGASVATVSYKNDIVPLLNAGGCLTSACHGGTFPASQYDLRTYEASFRAGDDAKRIGVCEIVPGDPEASFFLEKLRSDNPAVGERMPLERDPLTDAEIEVFETWIREGAQDN